MRYILYCSVLLIAAVHCPATKAREALNNSTPFTVKVYDASDTSAVPLARVTLKRKGTLIVGEVTDVNGKAVFREVRPGWYTINVHYIGYNDYTDSILIDESHTSLTAMLQIISQGNVTVTAQHEEAISKVDVNNGAQVFDAETYHAAPTARMTTLVQENVAGAARAPTGEIHIRGQHGEFTYYVDGIPIPMGVFGGLNEVVDPKVVEHATFLTGGFPAEYGGQMAAIADIQNRVPGGFHLDASTYVGSYLVFNGASPFSPGADVASGAASSAPGDTLGGRVGPFRALNSNGQALSLSDHAGDFGYFLSGSRQETDRRIDNPVPTLYNDHGMDYFLYGKFEYLLGDKDYLTANLNFGKTNTEVPFDSALQGFSPDRQNTSNSFQTLSYYHTFSSVPDQENDLFIGLFARQGALTYFPSAVSPATFQLPGDSIGYTVAEDRSFSTYGVRTKYDIRFSHQIQFAGGLNFYTTTGTEDFTLRDSAGNAGPHLVSNYSGSDFGVFAQAQWHPYEWTNIELGVRYDQHIAPDMPLQDQISPRIRWNFLIDEANSAYVYYGKLFMPADLESVRFLTSNGAGGVAT
ncbi:MAG TPA: TonB-dependent receptor, partial [Candidatus Kapabacteria bacterium]|nr:TonB-dependent receptor [Candidatus Kapabacteria bacterium]